MDYYYFTEMPYPHLPPHEEMKSMRLTLPNKLFEYLMAGLPVLASDFPDMRAVVEESGAGTVANPQDSGEIREKIRSLLVDPTQRQLYRQAALTAAQHYNWEQEAPKLLDLYAGL